jgi:hypothetical protein
MDWIREYLSRIRRLRKHRIPDPRSGTATMILTIVVLALANIFYTSKELDRHVTGPITACLKRPPPPAGGPHPQKTHKQTTEPHKKH